jgi:hypothetical protein
VISEKAESGTFRDHCIVGVVISKPSTKLSKTAQSKKINQECSNRSVVRLMHDGKAVKENNREQLAYFQTPVLRYKAAKFIHLTLSSTTSLKLRPGVLGGTALAPVFGRHEAC